MCPSLRRWSLALLLLTGCAGTAKSGFASQGEPDLPSPLLVAAGDAPALFLGPDADAARIAFLSDRVAVFVAGARVGDRVPVRIDGPLRTRGYVQTAALRLRVQRRGRVRGAPVYVGPNDLLQVLGPATEPDRLAVRAHCTVAGRELGPFDGSYPSIGLAAHDAPADAEPPPAGQRYALPAGVRVDLREQPTDPPMASLDSVSSMELDVLNQQQGWAAVRAGQGPYLIGWTSLPTDAVPLGPSTQAPSAEPTSATTEPEPAQPSAAPSPASPPAAPAVASAQAEASQLRVPSRIAAEPGELRRVVAGTKVAFGEQVIAVFKANGWARVLKSYEAGYADVFAAVDDDVTVRGLVRLSDLAPSELTETQQAAAPR